jgi:hypothetical protein
MGFFRINRSAGESLKFFLFLVVFMACGRRAVSQAVENPSDPLHPRTNVFYKRNDVQKSQVFYDSLGRKMKRNMIGKLVWDMAFKAPRQNTLPDSVQFMKSENPYEQYQGKVIRTIRILSLDPFGPSVIDTSRVAASGVIRALDWFHIQTAPFVLKNMMLIREGQKIDPWVLADQERLLKDLAFINDARVVIVPISGSDSADVVVITQDEWSIGIGLPVITPTRIVANPYDGNFMGIGDRLSIRLSAALNRMPFTRFDGFSYSYSNIMGSFINANVNYLLDDLGQINFSTSVSRPFVTNRTKFAGGISYEVAQTMYAETGADRSYSRYQQGSAWLGRAYLIRDYKIPTRFEVSGLVQFQTFGQRPPITVDSNRFYYDDLQVLASISFSRNNYYLIDYFLNFGKPENVPYGSLITLTAGPEWTTFYRRIYLGFSYYHGDFIKKFGYLKGMLDFGIYDNEGSLEDATLIAKLNYMSYLYSTPNKRFKFRSFVLTTCRLGFLRRTNNLDIAYLNRDMKINKVPTDTLFRGVQSLSLYFITTCYPPWYFFGFRCGFTGAITTGISAGRNSILFNSRVFAGFGLGMLIKNDNLIFPTLLISAFVYPYPNQNGYFMSVYAGETPILKFTDYNPDAPYMVTLAR